MEFLLLVIAILLGIVCAILTSRVADSKGWEASGWFIAGLLLGPLALLAVVGLPDKKLRQYVRALALKLDAIEVELPHTEIAAAQESVEFTSDVTVEDKEADYQKLRSLLDPKLLELINEKSTEITPKNIVFRNHIGSILVNANSVVNGTTKTWRIVYQKQL